ncbi:MAG: hypothetical protein JOZ46_03935 [Candidatus Dormibacteraeota bacterium]|nr:hypothetical protein [Candidatus Dormibacteraeota bacterium]MBV9524951.1 hypothetical protein [Candidatus Dormibacteraeota bacterium]
MTGAYSVSGAFTARPEIVLGGSATPAPAGYSCADYAAGRLGSNGEFALPEVETHGDPSVYVHLTVTAGYTGAGTYDSSTGHNVTGGAVVTEGNTSNGGFLDAFRAASDTTISVTVHPDGSGVVNALNWYSSDSDSELSGVITWTCSP